MNSYSFTINEKFIDKLKSDLESKNFEIEDLIYGYFKAINKTSKVSVSVYLSKKVLIQGKGTEDFVRFYIEPEILKEFNLDYGYINFNEKIGMDESGKGDYFGPLVVAAVFMTKDNYKKLSEKGIKDSKTINDNNIPSLASIIKKECAYELLHINPLKYNELYNKFRNLNDLLTWAHLRCLKNLAEKTNAKEALLDKFCDEKKVIPFLKKMDLNINLKMEVRGESDLSVAAASILARNVFLEQIDLLSKEYQVEIPKGGGSQTIKAGKVFIKKYGLENLNKIAKLHFKNTDNFYSLL